jgi:hypothetical protein
MLHCNVLIAERYSLALLRQQLCCFLPVVRVAERVAAFGHLPCSQHYFGREDAVSFLLALKWRFVLG